MKGLPLKMKLPLVTNTDPAEEDIGVYAVEKLMLSTGSIPTPSTTVELRTKVTT